MDEMTNDQLEAAANAPLRFRCNLANGLTSSAPTRYLEIDLSVAPQTVRNFVLVPGGRYLVTLKRQVVCLWDIGVVACEHDFDHKVAEVDCGIGLSEGAWMDAEFNGNELYVRVAASSRVGVWCTMYRINPLHDSPKFSLVGLLNTELFVPYSFHFDPYEMVLVYSTSMENGGNMWIWDLSTNSLATWAAGGQTVNCIYITEGHVLLISQPEPTQLMVQGDVYALPKFSQPSSPHHHQPLPSPFVHSINWENDFPDWSSKNSSIACPTWWEARKSHFPFDLIGWKRNNEDDSVSCEIVSKVLHKSSSDPSRLEAGTRHRGQYNGKMSIPSDVLFTTTYLPDEVRIMYWVLRGDPPSDDGSNPQKLYVHVTSLTEKVEDESRSVDMCMPLWTHWDDQHMFWGLFGFSAATGRFCVMDDDDLLIVDYGV